MKMFLIIIVVFFVNEVWANSAVQQAVIDAKINKRDSFEVKIDKALWLLNEKNYFKPVKATGPLPPPFDIPYQLDSLRSPEQVLAQKNGGSCGSSALAFAAMLHESGISLDDIQIVAAVVNRDLAIICPKAGQPRVANALSGAPGHVFVALRFPTGRWKIINSIDGSRNYERADWMGPVEIQKRLNIGPIEIPDAAFSKLPAATYSSGMTLFQSWRLDQVPLHTFEQRYNLIASGQVDSTICRFAFSGKER